MLLSQNLIPCSFTFCSFFNFLIINLAFSQECFHYGTAYLEILHLKNQPCNRLYPKKPAGMHWLGYNGAVSWVN